MRGTFSVLATAMALVFMQPSEVSAQSGNGRIITYNSNGNIAQVVRSTPSGVAIYNGSGNITRVVRRTPSGFVTVDGRGRLVGATRVPPPSFASVVVDTQDNSVGVLVQQVELRDWTVTGGVGNAGYGSGLVGGVQDSIAGVGLR